jgi:hypothetical protein
MKLTLYLIALIIIFTSVVQVAQNASSSQSEGGGQITISSPFGIFAVFGEGYGTFMKSMNFSEEDYWKWAGDHFRNINAKWSRGGDRLIWKIVEPELGGGYNWVSDRTLKAAYRNGGDGFNMVAVISPSRIDKKRDSRKRVRTKGSRDQKDGRGRRASRRERPRRETARGGFFGINESEETDFKGFIKAVVERYDGDGNNDFDSDIKMKYWQASNEPFPRQWKRKGGTVESYVRFLELMSEAAREADPQAKIVLGAQVLIPNPRTKIIDLDDFKATILAIKNKNLIDVVDLHYWGRGGNYKVPRLAEIKNLLNENGYGHVKIFLLEHGTYVGQPQSVGKQTEKDQAIYLIKSYVYNIANGVSVISWNNLVEWASFGGRGGSTYNYMGLISDGENGDDLNVNRLSYYTYKKMVEVLDESDWKNIQKIREKNGVYIYKFVNKNRPIWVAWMDKGSREVEIKDILSKKLIITKTVPSHESGSEVKDYKAEFESKTISVNNKRVTLNLTNIPVFLTY